MDDQLEMECLLAKYLDERRPDKHDALRYYLAKVAAASLMPPRAPNAPEPIFRVFLNHTPGLA
jgi:hypothetical protein